MKKTNVEKNKFGWLEKLFPQFYPSLLVMIIPICGTQSGGVETAFL